MIDTIFVWAKDAPKAPVIKAPVIALKLGEKGFYQIWTDLTPEELNEYPASAEVIESAVSASIFGWNAPIAMKAWAWFNERNEKEKHGPQEKG